MWIVNIPTSSPCLFWTFAFVWSAFQAWAGFHYGLHIYDSACRVNINKPYVRLLAYGFHHGAWYFFCSLSGFIAWCVAHWVSSRIGNWSDVASGTGAIIVALAALSVLGVSGALSRILYLGKKPV